MKTSARQYSEVLLDDLIRRLHEAPCQTLDLSTRLGISKPNLSHCIQVLRQRGYAIRTIRGCSGWAYELVQEPASRSAG